MTTPQEQAFEYVSQQEWFVYQVKSIYWVHDWIDKEILIGFWFYVWIHLAGEENDAAGLKKVEKVMEEKCSSVCVMNREEMEELMIKAGFAAVEEVDS
jgi:hypothetical protein